MIADQLSYLYCYRFLCYFFIIFLEIDQKNSLPDIGKSNFFLFELGNAGIRRKLLIQLDLPLNLIQLIIRIEL